FLSTPYFFIIFACFPLFLGGKFFYPFFKPLGYKESVTSQLPLWELARDGKAPKFLGKLDKRGVPVNALIVTALVGTVAFLASFFGDGAVYNWLLNASGLSGFIAWLGIAISHYRFRRAYVAQGKALSDLPYRSKWFPFGPLFAFAVCTVVILGQNYQAFLGDHIKWGSVFVSYIGLPIFIAVWLIYKCVKKTKVVSLRECDFNREP
ncbi:amino acid permease, partial [Heyndrickxia coagulans]|uniref:amino acid permease n=1 Tax=Heyndrickxia coagulans TaxID=1398 RepID=UPI00214D8E58